MNIISRQTPNSKAPATRINPIAGKTEPSAALPTGLTMNGDLLRSVASSLLMYRDLAISFTSAYVETWSGRGSGALREGSTWQPQAAAGQTNYFALGDVMIEQNDNYDPSGRMVSVMVADVPEQRLSGKGPALAAPIGCEDVWNGKIYQLTPPQGYVALGGIAVSEGQPDLSQYRCIRADLVVQAGVSDDELFDDQGSSARQNLSVWTVQVPNAPAGKIYVAPPTFVPVLEYDRPGPADFYCLQFEIPDNLPAAQATPQTPGLTSFNAAAAPGRAITYTAFLPWYAVRDRGLTDVQRMQSSPVYSLCRADASLLLGGQNNQTGAALQMAYTATEGISPEDTASFVDATGISLGRHYRFTAGALTGAIRLKDRFTYTAGQPLGMEAATTDSATLTIPPGVNAAVYSIVSTYSLQRQDGTLVSPLQPQFGRPDSTVVTQFPVAGSVSAAGIRTGTVQIHRAH